MTGRETADPLKNWFQLGISLVVPTLAVAALLISIGASNKTVSDTTTRVDRLEAENLEPRLTQLEGNMHEVRSEQDKLYDLMNSINVHLASLDEQVKTLIRTRGGETWNQK